MKTRLESLKIAKFLLTTEACSNKHSPNNENCFNNPVLISAYFESHHPNQFSCYPLRANIWANIKEMVVIQIYGWVAMTARFRNQISD